MLDVFNKRTEINILENLILRRGVDSFMKNKPDDRRDNAAKIQKNLNHTLKNMEAARDMMAKTDDPKTKRDLEEKNKRRNTALDMRKEIKDESKNSQKGYE